MAPAGHICRGETFRACARARVVHHRYRIDGFGLRVGVQPGGCSGYSYLLDIDERDEDDVVIELEGLEVYMDPKSHQMLDGLRIDYETSLLGGGFKFENPNATKSCGCGTSFC